MSPTTRQEQGRRERPMQAAYLAHIETCEAVEIGLWCCVCSALCAAADIESSERNGWPDDDRVQEVGGEPLRLPR